MKVIEPLFLNDLKEEFENARGNNNKLNQLLYRLKNIKIFDPACGSGNFLIIAYKELRRLEMEIFKEMGSLALSEISLNQFFGIELDDFAHEIAILALWLTKHQMNVEFFKEFGRTNPTLPLTDAGNILQGNACRLDWEEVCPKGDSDEIYILGNPPYVGGKSQTKSQKEDMSIVFNGVKKYKELDYIGCWFYKSSLYLNNVSKFAFVTTSSVNQGAQVSQLWPLLFDLNLEIIFAHLPFPWSNNAKDKAGVSVSIIGITKQGGSNNKYIYSINSKRKVNIINGYLSSGNNIIVQQKLKPLSDFPAMLTGNSPYENNNLRFDSETKDKLITQYPKCAPLIKQTIGANELLKDIKKWCLWISNDDLSLALSVPEIKKRIDDTKEFRIKGGDVARGIANRPHQFRYTHSAKSSQIIIPIVSSERREYIPVGFKDSSAIVISSAAALYDPEPWLFSIISSKMHNCWIRVTAGKLDSRIRYLSALCYNTFPFPSISKQRKEELTQCTLKIIDERLKHSEKTLAQLYDPDKMPEGLKEAHRQNDLAVERCYRSTPFNSDEERLEYLFKLYEKMIQEEKDSGTLFAKQKKTRKRK